MDYSNAELIEKFQEMKSILINRSTGKPADDNRYRVLRQQLMEDSRASSKLPSFVRNSLDLETYW